jgi:hypothetical protein
MSIGLSGAVDTEVNLRVEGAAQDIDYSKI